MFKTFSWRFLSFLFSCAFSGIPVEFFSFTPDLCFLTPNILKVTSSSNDFSVSVPFSMSKLQRPVAKNGLPRRIGVSSSSGMSMMWVHLQQGIQTYQLPLVHLQLPHRIS